MLKLYNIFFVLPPMPSGIFEGIEIAALLV
jgi:hypothetical protein